VERLPRKKPFTMLVGGLGERVPYLVIALAIWWLAEPAPTAALIVIFTGLAVSYVSAGIGTPAWYDIIAKAIPVRRRGLWSGTSFGLGALLGVAGAALVGRILERWPYPDNFALCFGLAFGATAISFGGFALNREVASPSVKPRTSLRHYFRQLPAILRRDRNYVRYLISRSVLNLGSMANGFFLVYATTRFSIGGAEVGLLTGVLVGSQALFNFAWGLVGDRYGHKAVLCGAGFSVTAAAVITWLAPSPAWLLLSFVLLGAHIAGDLTAGLNIILEFCLPEDRPTYIGLTNTLLAPLFGLAPILGGWLATWAGYSGLFVAAPLLAGLGSLLMALWVREPRHIDPVAVRRQADAML
jgi:MFS family permease